ncbi:hypothetical protein GON03_03190 [Nocardioides sp. MAH-18]|uniref:Uncharacterized protein n=1 Tax=Nocardioides agri TaxID=2682843 RepID=A0A6L6XMU8_9ACTN|nr:MULTISPECIES: hypothetical protein [unclassified Nocardioides]MBA2953304.1 hypothetical protein [Nocardioides sp. CGMCC 1.13656]MVQ48172.1 hypothetical protein [Nocardioides sp. MAH-18]
MNPSDYGVLVAVLLGLGVLVAVAGWSSPAARRVCAPATVLLLLAAAIFAAAPDSVAVPSGSAKVVFVGLAGLLAVAGGGPLTALVFDLVDRRETPADSLALAGHVLRGGAWIGGLERAATFATLVTGWPEGLAIVLALKGLGRYPELRAAESGVRSGAAERFIIGTFVSVLWACGCAGVVVVTTVGSGIG